MAGDFPWVTPTPVSHRLDEAFLNTRSHPARCRARLVPLAVVLGVLGCGRTQDGPNPAAPQAPAAAAAGSHCPSEPLPSDRVPGTATRHRDPHLWIDKLDPALREAVLVSSEQLEALHRRWSETPGAWRDPASSDAVRPEATDQALTERMSYMRDQVGQGILIEDRPGLLEHAQRVSEASTQVDHERLVVQETPLRCIPSAAGIFKPQDDGSVDREFDRNACSSLHPGEWVRVLRNGSDGWLFVHAGYTVGWVQASDLSERLSREQHDAWHGASRLVPVRDDVQTEDGIPIRIGVSVPLLGQDERGYDILVASPQGPRQARVPLDAAVHAGRPALTRTALLQVAFSMLDQPYGWGGRQGHRDCSRYLRDLLATFGLQLGRHSAVQAQAGTVSVDLEGMSEDDKLQSIEHFAERGIVLLYMPGHIMLYLGRDEGHHYAVSAISEWLEPCEGGPDTVHRIDKVAVTTLEVGRGTQRTAFIERLTRLAVFGPTPESADPDSPPSPPG